MGSMSSSSCRCSMFVCILWQFSMLHDLQFVNARGDFMEEAYSRSGIMTAL